MIPRRILICGLNWVGDNIMAMPALQAYRRLHASDEIAVLVKRGMGPLWQMHTAPNRVLAYDDSTPGTFAAGFALRREGFEVCFVLPHSFRSAWIPFLARIPIRRGLPGGARDRLLTEVITPSGGEHQQFEYFSLLAPGEVQPEPPRLTPPPEAEIEASDLMDALPRPLIGLIPGAARGAAKRWPLDHFIALGRRFARERNAGIVVFGAPGEAALCSHLAQATDGRSLAGRTSLPTWAAAMKQCDAIVCNDSGGMHLAAALGARVVAVYGMTNAAKTGPLGPRARVVQDDGPHQRDIPRESAEAERRLAAIGPDRVYRVATEFLTTS